MNPLKSLASGVYKGVNSIGSSLGSIPGTVKDIASTYKSIAQNGAMNNALKRAASGLPTIAPQPTTPAERLSAYSQIKSRLGATKAMADSI